jgi:hypothetical protein
MILFLPLLLSEGSAKTFNSSLGRERDGRLGPN